MTNNFKSNVKQPWTTYDNGLIQQRGIFKNATQKMAYMYLVSFSNANKIFPSMDAIAEAICSTPRTAMNIIQQLEELGLIDVERRPGLSNIYTLNDYFEVVEAMEEEKTTSEKISPVKKFHGTREKISPPPVKKFHPKTKTIKLKTKNKISSSSERQSIDIRLKEKYPKVPFEEIRETLLNDDSAVINTNKQYKSMLEYRLKNWKPRQPKQVKTSNKANRKTNTSNRKPIRKELLPEWFDSDKEKFLENIRPKTMSELDSMKKELTGHEKQMDWLTEYIKIRENAELKKQELEDMMKKLKP